MQCIDLTIKLYYLKPHKLKITKISAKASLTIIVLFKYYIYSYPRKGQPRIQLRLLHPWHYWHSELDSFFVVSMKGRAILCTVEGLAVSLTSTHWIPRAPTNCDNQKCLETFPNVPWGAKLPLDETQQYKTEGRKEEREGERGPGRKDGKERVFILGILI